MIKLSPEAEDAIHNALLNWQWMTDHPHSEGPPSYDGYSRTVIHGHGGMSLEALAQPGMTPYTS